MSQENETFFTSIGCMDGRVQGPIARWGQERFDARFADTITEAGLVGQYAEAGNDSDFGEAIKFKAIDVSVGKHNSRGIVVHGHQECAGNQVDDELHKKQVLRSAELVRELDPGVEVIPVFVNRRDSDWVVEEIK